MAPNASVDIYARLYNGGGTPQGNEFPVNTDFNPCADPAVAAGSDGGFVVTWDARDMTSPFGNGLDIYACSFNSAGAVVGTVMRVNSYLYGDQYAPRIACVGTDYLIVWTSLDSAAGGLRTIPAWQWFNRWQSDSGEYATPAIKQYPTGRRLGRGRSISGRLERLHGSAIQF